MADALEIPCRAKLNLALAVGAPLAGGMHPIASWMVTLDFSDTMHLTRLPEESLSLYAIQWHKDAPRRSEIDWPITKDLAVRAHRALEEVAGRELPLRMRLDKRIPVGGGLGGGSANAAAMLRGANELFELGLAPERLAQIAATLGSDVPFLVRGGSALVTGLGEGLEHLAPPTDCWTVLVFPGVACPTGRVYAAFDELARARGGHAALREDEARALAAAGAPSPHEPFNDLAEPARVVAPALEDDIEEVAALAGRPVHVCGSGSSLFLLCGSEIEATALAKAISDRLHLPATAARTTA